MTNSHHRAAGFLPNFDARSRGAVENRLAGDGLQSLLGIAASLACGYLGLEWSRPARAKNAAQRLYGTKDE